MTEIKEWQHRIAYLGPEASFTYLATKGLFPNEWLVPQATIPECIEAVAKATVDLAVVPLENALEGSVPLTLDYLFHEVELFVTGEILLPIAQHLMVNPAQQHNWENLEGVYSHPHALA
ncbi:prephenate dehydratase domain-containing protein, partial [Salmonella enterica]|uniref:prephenate dehydratase domain-containing protein n=1 Tax=Salmonella enterica TaxID=28901 RepID=UPI0011926870